MFIGGVWGGGMDIGGVIGGGGLGGRKFRVRKIMLIFVSWFYFRV